MTARPRMVINENPDYPTTEQIERYYFDLYEARDLLRCCEWTLLRILKEGKIFAVKHKKKWYIRPDQISLLRTML